VFARFRAKFMDTSLDIPTTVYADVIKLFGAAQAVYKEEKDRAGAMAQYLVDLMGDSYTTGKVTGAEPDGVVTTTMHDRPTAYRCIVEIKNEVGTGGCDPCCQAVIGYEKCWLDSTVRHIDHAS
jgi:hypothetical protein